jgi:hypothetical protein
MSAPLLGRDIRGTPAPHVAISREERDLAHAGYDRTHKESFQFCLNHVTSAVVQN